MDLLQKEFDALLAGLPRKQNRSFENMIADYIMNQDDVRTEDLRRFLVSQINGEAGTRSYVSFLCLSTFYRRNKYVSNLKSLFEMYGERFRAEPLYLHYKALMHQMNYEYEDSIDCYERLFERRDEMMDNCGILHGFAEVIILMLEKDPHNEDLLAKWKKGFSYLERAISIEDYAKFYATRARYYAFEKQYDLAIEELRKAIDKEEVSQDYQLRIAGYYQMISAIEVQELLEDNRKKLDKQDKQLEEMIRNFSVEVEEKVAEQEELTSENLSKMSEMIEGMKRQNLQMLGFFTAIISFTIGSFQIIHSVKSFHEAFPLLMSLGAVLLIAYVGFSYTIFKRGVVAEEKDHRSFVKDFLPLFIVGLVLISCALVYYHLLS